MLDLIHTSSHVPAPGSWRTQDCQKGTDHMLCYPRELKAQRGPDLSESHQLLLPLLPRGDQMPAKSLPALFRSFSSLPWLSCSASPSQLQPPLHQPNRARKQAASPSAATTYLAAGRHARDRWALLPTSGLAIKKRIQQHYWEQANVSLGWQLGYRLFYSRYLVSSRFSAKMKDKKCQEAFSSSKTDFYVNFHY